VKPMQKAHRVTLLRGAILAISLWTLAACATAVGEGGAAAERSLVEVSPGMHTLRGPAADFDPANASVDLRLPPGRRASPLIIFVHGGGGARDSLAAMAAFHAAGIAVLGFDAYRMNGFDRDWRFWVRNMTYEARQRMIYVAALGAYHWAIAQPEIDAGRIYLYGLSNGADVVANLAAVVDPKHVRAAFAEGLAGAGLGLPNDLRVPLRAIFGRQDNYAGQTADDVRWLRRVPCFLNIESFDRPPGNAAACNAAINPRSTTQSPADWVAAQKAKGADVDIWFYENAAHGIFTGPLRLQMMQWPGRLAHASVGADDAARAALRADVLSLISQSAR